MTDREDRERAIQELMRTHLLSERMAGFIYAIESGEIPGDVMYMKDGKILGNVPAIPLRPVTRPAQSKQAEPEDDVLATPPPPTAVRSSR
jgi:hypothetical protein